MKNFLVRPYILGREDPKERSNFGLKIEFLHIFSLKFDLPCRKIEASQGFWYQGVEADIFFPNLPLSICIKIIVPVTAHFP